MKTEELRITKLRDYLYKIIKDINSGARKPNANVLDKNIDSYSLDKIPTASTIERWITGLEIHRDLFSFRSRKSYSYNDIENLANMGFFEAFEEKIKEKNEREEFPEIEGIESVACLNCGTMVNAEQGTATFDIQIEITYRT